MVATAVYFEVIEEVADWRDTFFSRRFACGGSRSLSFPTPSLQGQ